MDPTVISGWSGPFWAMVIFTHSVTSAAANDVTKIRQDFWKSEEYIPLGADEYDFEYHNGAIVYNNYDLHVT